MKVVEVRRHSVRDKPEPDLSSAGRALAQEVGSRVGPFQRCVSSPVPRAVQTAEAMGFPPTELDPLWGTIADTVVKEIGWPAPFWRVKSAVLHDGPSARFADLLLGSVRSQLAQVQDRGALLITTHGGFPELLAVRALPHLDPRPWGGVLRCMEGVRLTFQGGTPPRIEVLRVPEERTRI